MTDHMMHRGWTITVDPKPIAHRGFDWEATNADLEKTLYASSFPALLEEIDQFIDEMEDAA